MKQISPRHFYPLLFLPLAGDISESQRNNFNREAIVIQTRECSNKSIDDAIQTVRKRATTGAKIQVMVPAGPNRTRNQEAAIELANGLSEAGFDVSLEAKVDIELGETSDQADIEGIHSALAGEVHFYTTEQSTGTSYTEAALSAGGTVSSDLVFVAHNRPYQWRLEMAASNVAQANSYGLSSIHVFCHDSDPLPGNAGKETLSFLLDKGTDVVGGHELVMETSVGGMRRAKLKSYLNELTE